MQIKDFYHDDTGTLTYVVYDETTKDAVVIDPVLDFNPVGSKTGLESVKILEDFITENGLTVHYLLETHAHADHLSGAEYLKQAFPAAKTAISADIPKVQQVFKGIFNLADDFAADGSQFDELLENSKTYQAGTLAFKVIFTPGHTPACACYQFEDAVFTGDLLFLPDVGVARCDFPAGSAADLYDSLTEKIYSLPDETRIFVGHDYPPNSRDWAAMTTVAASKASNKELPASRSKDDFIALRNAADAKMPAPRLLYQSVQVNIAAGRLPKKQENGMRYLNMPIFEPTN